jgi:DNA polymerase III subunit chi
MLNIQFYHLLSTPLETALPKLVHTAYQKGMRVCIVAEPSLHPLLDDALWTFRKDSFLPHGTEDADAALHPILLASAPTRINDASVLMLTNGHHVAAEATEGFERVFDLFNGHDEGAVEAARQRWATYLSEGYALKYIKQRPDSGWDTLKETKAASETNS